jgi:hypothetical protein
MNRKDKSTREIYLRLKNKKVVEISQTLGV